MKTNLKRSLTLGTVLLSFVLISCADPYGYGYGASYGPGGYGRPPAQGAVAGALLGAAAGGIIGNQSRRGLEGAAIGGLLGAFAGGGIQNSCQQRQFSQFNAPNCNPGHHQGFDQGYGYDQPHYGYGHQSSYSPYSFGNWQ